MISYDRYNRKITVLTYAVGALVYGVYGIVVCPFIESLAKLTTATQVFISFTLMLAVRLVVTPKLMKYKQWSMLKADVAIFTLFGVALATFMHQIYAFPLESNIKVIFGMMVLGVFSGMLLQQLQLIEEHQFLTDSKQFTTVLKGKRQSITSDLVVLITLLVITLTAVLSMIALKDLYWLEAHKNNYLDGTGHISIIKEFLFVGLVMLGYTLVIIRLASKAIKQVLDDNEATLSLVAAGDLDARLTLVRHDELGVLSFLTNEMLEALKNSFIEVHYTRDTAILGLSALAESRDNETGAHIIRTQQYVKALAVYLSKTKKYNTLLTPQYIELLHKSAPLHDVGKVGIPDNILLKPGKLSEPEFEIMKQHAQIGADALSSAESQLGENSFLRLAKEIALTHHEKWDGSGYPAQLKGEEIPLSGRLMALGDVYDALISKRVYKPAFSHEKAKNIILEGNGLHFDPNVVDAFLAVEAQFKQIADSHQDNGLKA